MTDVLDESVDQMYWDTSTDPPKLRAGSTPVSVAHLSDTQISSPTDGQVLTWNLAASKWENETSGGGLPSGMSYDPSTNNGTLNIGAAVQLDSGGGDDTPPDNNGRLILWPSGAIGVGRAYYWYLDDDSGCHRLSRSDADGLLDIVCNTDCIHISASIEQPNHLDLDLAATAAASAAGVPHGIFICPNPADQTGDVWINFRQDGIPMDGNIYLHNLFGVPTSGESLQIPPTSFGVINQSLPGYHSVAIGADTSLPQGSVPGAFSVEAICAISSASSFPLINWGAVSPHGFALLYKDATHISVADPTSDLAPAWTVASQSDNTFRLYEVTFDGVHTFELWINGVSQGTKVLSAGFALNLVGANGASIGGPNTDAGFDGTLGPVAVYPGKLTNARIAAHYAAWSTGNNYPRAAKIDLPLRLYLLTEYPRVDVSPSGAVDIGSSGVNLAFPTGGLDVGATAFVDLEPAWSTSRAYSLQVFDTPSAISGVKLTNGTPGSGPVIIPDDAGPNTSVGITGKGNQYTYLGSITSPVRTQGKFSAYVDQTGSRAIDGTVYTNGNYRRTVKAIIDLTAAAGTADVIGTADVGGTTNVVQEEFKQSVAGVERITLELRVDSQGNYNIQSTLGTGASATLIKWSEFDE